MRNIRKLINGVSLAIVLGGGVALSPSEGHASVAPADGGTCCNQSGATCYLDVGGRLIIQSGAYYSSGAC